MTQIMPATDSATKPVPVAQRRRNGLVLPLTAAAVVYLCIAMQSAISRTLTPWPMTPWESAIVVDSWRALHGQAVYTDPTRGPATLMYGPLGVFSNVPLAALFGADVRLTRILPLAMTLLLCAGAAWLCARRGDRISRILIASLCFLQFYRIRDWAVEARPDAALAFFSFVAIVLFFRSANASTSRARLMWMFGGTGVLILGFFFKQPAAIASLVPLAMLFVARQPNWASRLAMALIPILAVAVTVLAIRQFWPWGYFYMIRVPGSYGVPMDGWAASVIELIRFSPLAIAILFAWIAIRREQSMEAVDQWLLVTAVITGLFGAAARAKFGGYYNSHLPAMIALAIFAGRALPQIFDAVASNRIHRSGTFVLAGLAPLVLVADVSMVTRNLHPGRTTPEHGDAHYHAVIETVRGLEGRVVCPDDPSIPLLAKAYAGRSGQCELDANNQRMPITVRREIRSADWYVQVVGERRPMYSGDALVNFGFEPIPGLTPEGSVYALWKRLPPPTTGPN